MKNNNIIFVAVLFLGFNYGAFSQASVQRSLGEIKKIDTMRKSTVEKRNSEWLDIQSISIYGGGSLIGLVTSTEKAEESTSPAGSIGINLSTNRISGDIFFSYKGKQDVSMSDLSQFGNSLMNPNISGQSISLHIMGKLHEHYGFSGSYMMADNNWVLDENTTIDASPIVGRIGMYFRPFNFEKINNNNVDFTLNFHYTHRSIQGDFGNSNQTIGGQLIESRGYNGFDLSANIILDSLHLFVQYSINGKDKLEIPGFSGTQVVFGVNVTGDVISL